MRVGSEPLSICSVTLVARALAAASVAHRSRRIGRPTTLQRRAVSHHELSRVSVAHHRDGLALIAVILGAGATTTSNVPPSGDETRRPLVPLTPTSSHRPKSALTYARS